jgi:alpha-mannosidase
LVRALKRAESGEGIVIRLVEPGGERLTVTIGGEAVGREIQTTLQPFEVQTLLVPDNGEDPVRPVSLAEYDLES